MFWLTPALGPRGDRGVLGLFAEHIVEWRMGMRMLGSANPRRDHTPHLRTDQARYERTIPHPQRVATRVVPRVCVADIAQRTLTKISTRMGVMEISTQEQEIVGVEIVD